MNSISFRLLLVGTLPAAGCEMLASLTPAPAGGNARHCRAYVQHVNELSPCLGLTYDAENFCEGVDHQPADLGPFYECLVAHTSCEGDEPSLTVEACSPPIASRISP